MRYLFRIMMSPDAGGGAGNPAEEPGITDSIIDGVVGGEGESGGAGKQDEAPKDPAWMSQLPKEMRENKDYMDALRGYKNLGELAKAHFDGKKQIEGMIRIPHKGDSDADVKAFFNKLGMPLDANEYDLGDYDMDPESLKLAKDLFRQTAHKNVLTKAQAKNLWESQVAMAKAVGNIQAKQAQKVIDSFEPRYNALLEPAYPVEADRQAAIKGEIGLVSSMLSESPILAKAMKDSQLIYNPAIMHELASYVKKHTASFVDTKGGNNGLQKAGEMGEYSPEFMEYAKGGK